MKSCDEGCALGGAGGEGMGEADAGNRGHHLNW